jgi:hypothetical protein
MDKIAQEDPGLFRTTLGPYAAYAAAAALPTLYSSLPFYKELTGAREVPLSATDQKVHRELAKVLKSEGLTHLTDPEQVARLQYRDSPELHTNDPKLKAKRLRRLADALREAGPAHVIGSKHVYTPATARPGMLAHEMGHATGLGPRIPTGLHRLSRIALALGPILGGVSALVRQDEDKALRDTLISSGVTLPALAEELRASHRGSRLLGKAQVKGLGRLTPYAGLPTYMALASAPAATYLAKKLLGGYRSSTPQED